MSDIIISGYYGLGNSGDEALLKSIVSDLRSINPDITITALSGNAKLTHKLYGIRTVNRFNPFSVIKEFSSAKLLLSGGGTLVQDATSTRSLLYYLGIMLLAKKMGLRVMMYANGMGPIKDKNIKKVNKVLNEADLITLRENASLEEIARCGITKPQVIVTADPAFNLVASDRAVADKILSEFGITAEDKIIAVSVRNYKNLPENFAQEMATALDCIAAEGYIPVFIPMQLKTDMPLSLCIAGKMKAPCRIIDCEMAVTDMLAVIGRCTIACGMRLHMLIFASVMNVPMAGIAYDPKIKGFMDYMKQKSYVELEDFSADEFSDISINCIKNISLMKEKLERDLAPLRKLAKRNAHLAVELLDSN